MENKAVFQLEKSLILTSIVSEARNAEVTFVQRPQMKILRVPL